jgi:hypothetical protein
MSVSLDRPFATIVSGVPRSGTSLMMQMLAAGGMPLLVDHTRQPSVDNPAGFFEYAPVKASARDISWFVDACGRGVKVIYSLLAHLPPEGEIRLLLMDRDLHEVMDSQRAMLERAGTPSDPSLDLRLSQIFGRQLADARAWAARRPYTTLLSVAHSELIDDPGPIVADIDSFLGGGLDRPAMAACIDPSLYRSRRRMGA